jgi:hypothetical protein
MSNENEKRLRATLDRHRTLLHEKQLAAADIVAKDHDFMRQYVAHRRSIIDPTLRKLEKLVGEYGHDLLIEDAVATGSSQHGDETPIQATLLLKGYDHSYKRASPQMRFSANCTARTIDIYACDRVPHREGVSGQQDTRTTEELTADKIEELFLGILQRAFAH